MALFKKYRDTETGLPLTYHRVSAITNTTNEWMQLQVCSYLTQEDREQEKLNVLLQEKGEPTVPVYSTVHYYSFDYQDGATCTDVYEHLKKLPEFEGATDIFDDDDKEQ